MSQQEFEPSEQEYRDQHAYNHVGRPEEARPKDEPPGAYGAPSEQIEYAYQEPRDYQADQARQTRVPSWARARPRQSGQSRFIGLIVMLLLVGLLVAGLGVAGLVIGILAKLIGIILGALLAFFIFILLLVALILMIIRQALGRVTGYDRHTRHEMRRAARRAARRYWRGQP